MTFYDYEILTIFCLGVTSVFFHWVIGTQVFLMETGTSVFLVNTSFPLVKISKIVFQGFQK